MYKLKKIQIIAFLIAVCLLVGFLITPPVWRLKNGPITINMWRFKGKEEVRVGPGEDGWTPYEEISMDLINAVVVSEDAHFFKHSGIDPKAIWESMKLNYEKGKIVRGGSTITQQTIKLAFLGSEKTYFRKIREVLGALVAEKTLSKNEIITWYTNLVNFGPGIYGVKAAAHDYFDTYPILLTIQESAHLATVLPGPSIWSKSLKEKRLTEYGRRRYKKIILEMYRQGYITKELWESATNTGNFGNPVNYGEPKDEE